MSDAVLIAAIGILPGVLTALSMYRKHDKAMAEIAKTKASLGELNGHGTVQEQGALQIAELRSLTAEVRQLNARQESFEQYMHEFRHDQRDQVGSLGRLLIDHIEHHPGSDA